MIVSIPFLTFAPSVHEQEYDRFYLTNHLFQVISDLSLIVRHLHIQDNQYHFNLCNNIH